MTYRKLIYARCSPQAFVDGIGIVCHKGTVFLKVATTQDALYLKELKTYCLDQLQAALPSNW